MPPVFFRQLKVGQRERWPSLPSTVIYPRKRVILTKFDGNGTIMTDLSGEDRAALALAGLWWQNRGAYDRAIVERLHTSPTRHAQRLNRLLDDPAAAVAAPLLVARLRRIRDRAVSARSGVRDGTGPAHH